MTSLESNQRPHAFLIPFPVQGHIQGFMRLSKLLSTRYGYLISFFNSEENHVRLVSTAAAPSQNESQAADCKVQLHDMRMLYLPDRPPSPLDMEQFYGSAGHIDATHFRITKTFFNTDLAALEALIRSQTPPITCLIFDPFVPIFAPHLPQILGLPMCILYTASAASLAMTIQAARGGVKQMKRSAAFFPETNPFCCGHDVGVASDFMPSLFTQPFREKLVKESDIILINTCEEVEGSIVEHLKEEGNLQVYAIGPLLLTGGSIRVEESGCMEWLDKQPAASVLFVSFGSIASLSATQFLELALGLEASNQRILWVIRPDLIYGQAPNLPFDFLERIKERVLIISWAPQMRVLRHSAVGGFLSHRGWNSTLESISAGVPILAWPSFGDQNVNAHLVVRAWHVGLSLIQDGLISQTLVESRVRDLMERDIGKELRERAQGLKESVRGTLSKGGSSFNNLHHLFGHASSNV